ncbi:hypothetical protein AAVH_11713 [Aphelenchoides avenae]|nr:hypothetical protein AAVH_11713 [Aphelenchus avenae]
MFTESTLNSLAELINASMANSNLQNGVLDSVRDPSGELHPLKLEENGYDYDESSQSPLQDNDGLWKILQSTLGLTSTTSPQNGAVSNSTSAVIDVIAERVTNQVTERVSRQLTDVKMAIIGLTKAMDDMRKDIRRSSAQAPPRKMAKRNHFPLAVASPSGLSPCPTIFSDSQPTASNSEHMVIASALAAATKPRKDACIQLKTVGIPVLIGGEVKLARQCSADVLASAVREQQAFSEPVMYKGVDMRPYALKFQDVFVVVLNDARLFGRHVADFLWPMAHFKDYIIKSRLVTSRSKKDSMGKPKVFVPAEEEEVFYGLLNYLGGLITSKPMDFAEACRAAVNQRGNEHKRTDGTPNPAYYHSAFGPGFVPLFVRPEDSLGDSLPVE